MDFYQGLAKLEPRRVRVKGFKGQFGFFWPIRSTGIENRKRNRLLLESHP